MLNSCRVLGAETDGERLCMGEVPWLLMVLVGADGKCLSAGRATLDMLPGEAPPINGRAAMVL